MASYRPFPPLPPRQSNFGPPPPPLPNHSSLPPPPLAPLPQPRGSQYSQNWGYPDAGFQQGTYAVPPGNPVANQQQQFTSYPPPPPPESAYPPPPPPSQPAPPGQMYFPSSQYAQLPNQPVQPPPPPSPPSSPLSSSVPPPPPPPVQPPSPPPPPSSAHISNQAKESKHDGYKRPSNDLENSKWRDPSISHHGVPSRQHSKPSHLPPVPARKSNGPQGRVETEEERRLRKKREMEKQRQEEKHRQQLKESLSKVFHQKTKVLHQKTQVLSSGIKPHGSVSGSHMGDRRATSFLSGERIEIPLKKPTTFLCKLKFQDELPDPTSQPKPLIIRRDKDRMYTGNINIKNIHVNMKNLGQTLENLNLI